MCSTYRISVRAYTVAGPGPFSQSEMLQTSGKCNYSFFSVHELKHLPLTPSSRA